ncbi:TetR family transcriptional regulator [Stenotrophomonas sp. YIM B06876]|uniref:TetR family transcriptional regulator n=1 Tax=Stenotrophomonas sp. YIM B06876 TaxID=3060211 RepID=UPI002738324D|nr:TetR family transcriptional regulator [Stenotrophomonas sp. YIM B06876]
MARRTKEEAQATREGILDAARDCFHEHGVAGASLAMIGNRAGFTRGAVYWHFKNKTEVLEALVKRERLPFIERLRRSCSAQRTTPVLDLRSALLVTLDELARDDRGRQTMEIMLRNDLSAESVAMQRIHKENAQEQMEIYTRVFTRARELGQLREFAEPRTMARMLHTCLTGVIYNAMIQPELFDIRRDFQQILDVVLYAHVKEGVFTCGAEPSPLPLD